MMRLEAGKESVFLLRGVTRRERIRAKKARIPWETLSHDAHP